MSSSSSTFNFSPPTKKSSNMSGKKWEELNKDCLSLIFSRVGIKSLVRFILFVCKSWYLATFDPQSWTNLEFSSAFYSKNLVKYAIGRAQRSATMVVFQRGFKVTREDLLCIAQGFPLLKTLFLPDDVMIDNSLLLSRLIVNWKHLEYLHLCFVFYFERILKLISLHCSNFVGFDLTGYGMDIIEHVSVIVKFTPNIKFLRMRGCWLSREYLVMLLQGCAALEMCDVSKCFGFEEVDDDIMKLASDIKSFKYPAKLKSGFH